jgi:hypothetical protein
MTLHRQYVQARLEWLLTGEDPGTGRLENVLRARLSEVDPLSGQPVYAALNTLATGRGGWLDQLNTFVGEPVQHATCGQLLALAGRYVEAAEQFKAASSFYQDPRQADGAWRPTEIQVRLWQEEVWWHLAAGNVTRARELARLFAAHTPIRMREAEFFRQVGAVPGDFE